MPKNLLTGLLIAILTVSMIHTTSFSETQYFRIANVSWGAEASPGDLNVPLTIYVQYIWTVNLIGIAANLSLPEGFSSTSGSRSVTVYSGPVTPGSIVPLTFYLSINPNTSLGLYIATLYISGQASTLNIDQSLSVAIDLRGRADLVFDAYPRSLGPGDVNEITLRAYNRGSGPAYNVSISYSLQGQGSILSMPATIASIQPGGYQDLRLQIYVPPSSALQTLGLVVSASYINPYYSAKTISQSIGLYVVQQPVQMISISPLTQGLVAGEINQVSLRIFNKGSSNIYNVIATISPSHQMALVGSDGRFLIGDLPPSGYRDISFSLYVSPQAPQIVSLQIQITYTDRSGVQRSDILGVSLSVEYQPGYFQVILAGWGSLQQQIQVGPGDSGVMLLVAVRYIGNSTAYNANFTLVPPSGIKILPSVQSASQYIPSIQPNSIVQLSYQVGIDPSLRTGVYRADLVVTWDTQSRPGYTQLLTIPLDIRGRADLYLRVADQSLDPGSINTISITVVNNGTGYAGQVAIASVQTSIGSVLSYDQRKLDLSPGESGSLLIVIYIPPTAQQSPLSLSITLSYIDPYGYLRSYSQQLGFYVLMSEQSLLIVNVSSNTIQPGFNNVSLYIVNRGSTPIYNLFLTVTPASPLALVNSDGRIYVGDLVGGGSWSSQLVIFMARPAATPQQMYSTGNVRVTLTYYDQSGSLKTETRDLFLIIYIPPIVSPIEVSLDPQVLVTGIINNASIYIRNTGSQGIDNITVSISTAGQLSIIGSGSFQVRRLSAGEQIAIPLKIYIPATASPTASLQVGLGYYLSGAFYQDTKILGVISRGIIEIMVTDYTLIPETPSPGQVFSITVTLTNQGTITASAVTAIPQQVQGFRLFGSRSVFIGDMQVNSPTIFTITLIALNTTSPGRYEIPVQLVYYDNLRTPNTVNILIPVTIGAISRPTLTPRSQEVSSFPDLSSYWWVFVVVMVAIAFAAGIYMGRRR